MLAVGIAIVIAFAIQILLSMRQMKHFAHEFAELRRRGRVACGRKQGGFRAGAIVMLLIDDDGIVQEARKLEGVTCFARVKPFGGLEGLNVADLTGDEVDTKNPNLRKAIRDASLSYRKFTSGEAIPEPPTPFQKAGNTVAGLFRREGADGKEVASR